MTVFLNLIRKLRCNKEILTNVAIGVLTFFMSIHFSKDWKMYQYYYETKIQNVDWNVLLTSINIFHEPLYLLSSKLFGQTVGYSVFIFLITVILLTFKLHYLKKITNSIYVGTFFYICFYLLLFEGTALRVAYATAFVMAALYCLKEQKPFPTVLLILLASQVHFTAIVFLIVIPLYYYKSANKFTYFVFIFSPFLIAFDTSVIGLLKDFVSMANPRYLNYFDQKIVLTQNSTGLFYYFIGFFALLLCVIFYFLKDKIRTDLYLQVIFSTTLCGVIAMCAFHDYVAVGARLGELLLLPIVILLSHLYQHFSANEMRIHHTALITLSLLYFSARVIYLYPTMFSV